MRHILLFVILAAVLFGDVYGIYPARVGKRSPLPHSYYANFDEGLMNRDRLNNGNGYDTDEYPGFRGHPSSRSPSSYGLRRNPHRNGNSRFDPRRFGTYSESVISPGYEYKCLKNVDVCYWVKTTNNRGQKNNNRPHQYLRSNDAPPTVITVNRPLQNTFERLIRSTQPGEENFQALKEFSIDLLKFELEFGAARAGLINGRDVFEINKQIKQFYKTKGVEFLKEHGNEDGKKWIEFLEAI